MRKKRKNINRTSTVRRERDPVPWKYCALTLVCGLLLVAGFFVAAKQHFSAVGIAMENADLRVKIVQLKDEKRRLTLSRERASSPSRISLAATKIGFSPVPRPVIASTMTTDDGPLDAGVERPVPSLASATLDRREPRSKTADDKRAAKVEKTASTKMTDPKTVTGNQVASLNRSEILKGARE